MFSFYSKPESFHCAYPQVQSALPPSQLGYHTNNVYDNFPPLMSDGRAITASYQPEAILNSYLLKDTGIQSNHEYRAYLTRNATDIMKYNRREAANDVGYVKRHDDVFENYRTPQLIGSILDKPMQSYPGQMGISDLKANYLTREQLQARQVAPQITQDELIRRGR